MAFNPGPALEVSHYINGPTELRAKPLSDNKMLVILDDVAGAGQSLSSAFTQAREAGFKGEIVISPMVSTTQAPKTVENGFGDAAYGPDGHGKAADAKSNRCTNRTLDERGDEAGGGG